MTHDISGAAWDAPSPARYQVAVIPIAIEDVARIREYIALSSPLSAARYALRLVESFDSLEILPRAWPRVATRKFGDVRYRIIGSHRVLFRIGDRPNIVTVLRVVHAQQSMRRVYAMLKGALV